MPHDVPNIIDSASMPVGSAPPPFLPHGDDRFGDISIGREQNQRYTCRRQPRYRDQSEPQVERAHPLQGAVQSSAPPAL
jgi:hypothetical protein